MSVFSRRNICSVFVAHPEVVKYINSTKLSRNEKRFFLFWSSDHYFCCCFLERWLSLSSVCGFSVVLSRPLLATVGQLRLRGQLSEERSQQQCPPPGPGPCYYSWLFWRESLCCRRRPRLRCELSSCSSVFCALCPTWSSHCTLCVCVCVRGWVVCSRSSVWGVFLTSGELDLSVLVVSASLVLIICMPFQV